MRGTTFPCFLLPAVADGDGVLQYQVSGEENFIMYFTPVPAKELDRCVIIDVEHKNLRLKQGEETYFAYAFSKEDYEVGTIDNIKRFTDGRSEINKLSINRKYELYSALKDYPSLCRLLEGIVRNGCLSYTTREITWAGIELEYLRINGKYVGSTI